MDVAPTKRYLTTDEMSNMTQLGKKLENPYTVENMQEALGNLGASNPQARSLASSITIAPSHLYIKFLPEDSVDMNKLYQDSTLILYDYPLDYEIDSAGSFYHDPTIPVDQPTYQYCAVTVDYDLPDVAYEVLAELFIPEELEEDSTEETGARLLASGLTDQLVDEALRITGNLEDAQEDDANARKSKWRGSGRIMTWDDHFGTVPLEGLEVRLTRFFRTRTGFTNSQGYFSCSGSRFRYEGRYSYKWERHQFGVRDGALSMAGHEGPKKRGSWNYTIANEGKQEYYSTIFRAAYHYYYQNIKGLRRPPKNKGLTPKMRIRAYFESNDDSNGNHAALRRVLGVGSQIKMYNPSRQTRDVYATVIHELAHASHWHMHNTYFNITNDVVKETWARGVQWDLTRMRYSTYRGGQTIRPEYLQLVIDLIDSPSDANNGYESISIDNVEGYTIRQIEDALLGNFSLSAWMKGIKIRYNHETENNIDVLLDTWQ
ncbi:hypothetical protein BGP76_17630 [Reichenbachiella sp. MSK19-1]|nr:hypothetical protein BGP76_17630 [Reichenbachiella sp. MSK19-1]